MEYLEGRDLAAVLAGKGRLSSDEAASIGLQLCESLADQVSIPPGGAGASGLPALPLPGQPASAPAPAGRDMTLGGILAGRS